MTKQNPLTKPLADIHTIVEALENIAGQLQEPASPHAEGVFKRQQAKQRMALDAALRRYRLAIEKKVKAL